MPSVLVCYLVAPGEAYAASASRFLESYRFYYAGLEHDRLLVVKQGAERPSGSGDWPAAYHPNGGFDISSLLWAAREHGEYDALMWLGSHARILSYGWLGKFWAALRAEDVGAVAATASFEAGVARCTPNPHLRTSTLAISPALLNACGFGEVTDRRECYEFEHGSDSLYRHLLARGLRGVVVGRSGRVYAEAEWAHSSTYRQGGQADLLIADNQTDAWQAAGPDERLALARAAGWEP